MKNLLNILVLMLMVMPMSANALTFEKPDRDLSSAELKLGSIYRGCIGFHCLEEAPFLEVSLEAPCAEGDACLTVATNAREGVVVLMTATVETTTCLDETLGGMEAMEVFEDGCAEIQRETPIMRSLDQVDEGFGRLKLTGATNAKLLSVIAY